MKKWNEKSKKKTNNELQFNNKENEKQNRMLKNRELDEKKICIFNRLIKISIDKIIETTCLLFVFLIHFSFWIHEKQNLSLMATTLMNAKFSVRLNVPSVECRMFPFWCHFRLAFAHRLYHGKWWHSCQLHRLEWQHLLQALLLLRS